MTNLPERVVVPMPDMQNTRVDALAIMAKGVLGAVPNIGPLMAEIAGAIIPNQRVNRIVRVVELLGRRVADLEQQRVAERLNTPEGVDLLEDGFHQAARALSDDRLEYIANLLRSGITEEQARMAEKKRLMWLLGQLDDAEIILLIWYSGANEDDDFNKRYWHVLDPVDYYGGMPDDETDRVSIRLSRTAHLHSLGLLEGRQESSASKVTPLGRLLLKIVTSGKYGTW